jgi:hypothetical protein
MPVKQFWPTHPTSVRAVRGGTPGRRMRCAGAADAMRRRRGKAPGAASLISLGIAGAAGNGAVTWKSAGKVP